MPTITLLYGAAMDLLGIAGYVLTNAKNPVALIARVVGTLALGCGLLALQRPELRKHVMHAAAVLGLIGLLGPLLPFVSLWLMEDGELVVARPAAFIAYCMMLVLSALFLAACIRSFVEARSNRSS